MHGLFAFKQSYKAGLNIIELCIHEGKKRFRIRPRRFFPSQSSFSVTIPGVCSKRRTHARGSVISCIQDTSRAVSNAVCSFQCGRKPFGLLPQGMRLRHPCRRLGKLDAALELRHGKETAASCIMMQSMTIPLAVRPSNLTFPSRLLV